MDVHQVLQGIHLELRCVGQHNDLTHTGGEEGVAIGRGFGNEGSSDVAGRTRLVFDQHGLTQAFLHRLGEQARQGVGQATGSEANNQLDGPLGPGARLGKTQ
jgi:hypothetical protein